MWANEQPSFANLLRNFFFVLSYKDFIFFFLNKNLFSDRAHKICHQISVGKNDFQFERSLENDAKNLVNVTFRYLVFYLRTMFTNHFCIVSKLSLQSGIFDRQVNKARRVVKAKNEIVWFCAGSPSSKSIRIGCIETERQSIWYTWN